MKLTKTELKEMIKESVKDVLNEISCRQKAQQAIKGVSNRIKTCAILTSENPFCVIFFYKQNYYIQQKNVLFCSVKIKICLTIKFIVL